MITVLGITFKEDVPDLRNSKVVDIVRELREFGITVQITDTLADPATAVLEFGEQLIALDELRPADALILAVPHKMYVEGGWPLVQSLLASETGTVIDVKSVLPAKERPGTLNYWRL